MVNTEVVKVVKEYLQELSLKKVIISKAFLFDSQVKGTATEESDIDLMLVSPLFDEDFDKYLPAIWLSSKRTENRIEPITIGEKRFWSDEASPIIGIVHQEGIEIAVLSEGA
jgi:uncharacterized protein